MTILVDAGPLYALLNRREHYHEWARRYTNELDFPFYTCEAVLSEAHFLLQRTSLGGRQLNRMIESGLIDLSFSYDGHIERVNELMVTYQSVPMSFADACLLRMAELHGESRIFTTDSDFKIYRKHRTERIELLMP